MDRVFVHLIRDDRGAVTIEFVLWIPIMVALLVTAIDATTLYVTQTEMWNVARDTARRMVTGRVLTEADAEAYAQSAIKLREAPYQVDAVYDKNVAVQVTISLAFEDMSIVGYGSPLTIFGNTLVARVAMRPDPRIPFKEGT
jgi:Flp pilus assembly protein TadG